MGVSEDHGMLDNCFIGQNFLYSAVSSGHLYLAKAF